MRRRWLGILCSFPSFTARCRGVSPVFVVHRIDCSVSFANRVPPAVFFALEVFMAAKTLILPAPATSVFFVPTGHRDNSPAFQRRGAGAWPPVPTGRLISKRTPFPPLPGDSIWKIPVVPPGLGIVVCGQPGVETPGYYQRFLRNRESASRKATGTDVCLILSASVTSPILPAPSARHLCSSDPKIRSSSVGAAYSSLSDDVAPTELHRFWLGDST